MADRERLLGLPDLGALEMAQLGGQAVQGAGGDRHRGHELSVPVACHDLRGHRLRAEADLVQHLGFEVRRQGGVRAHGARELADRALGDRPAQARLVPTALERIPGHLEAEAGRLRVDPVGTPHRDGVPMCQGEAAQGLGERGLFGDQKFSGACDRQAQPGVEDVRGRHAVVDPSGGRTHVFGHIGEKRDDIVVGRLLEFLRARHREVGLGLDLGEVLRRDDAPARPRPADGELDLEPPSELRFLDPDGGHRGP